MVHLFGLKTVAIDRYVQTRIKFQQNQYGIHCEISDLKMKNLWRCQMIQSLTKSINDRLFDGQRAETGNVKEK